MNPSLWSRPTVASMNRTKFSIFLPYGKAEDTASSSLPRVRGPDSMRDSVTLGRLGATAFSAFETIEFTIRRMPSFISGTFQFSRKPSFRLAIFKYVSSCAS